MPNKRTTTSSFSLKVEIPLLVSETNCKDGGSSRKRSTADDCCVFIDIPTSVFRGDSGVPSLDAFKAAVGADIARANGRPIDLSSLRLRFTDDDQDSIELVSNQNFECALRSPPTSGLRIYAVVDDAMSEIEGTGQKDKTKSASVFQKPDAFPLGNSKANRYGDCSLHTNNCFTHCLTLRRISAATWNISHLPPGCYVVVGEYAQDPESTSTALRKKWASDESVHCGIAKIHHESEKECLANCGSQLEVSIPEHFCNIVSGGGTHNNFDFEPITFGEFEVSGEKGEHFVLARPDEQHRFLLCLTNIRMTLTCLEENKSE